MATYLFAPPKTYLLPLSKGGDLIVDFKNRVDGNYTAYSAGVKVFLEIDLKTEVVRKEAVISTHHAVVRVESETADTIPKGRLWRCIIQFPGSPTTEVVAANGTTVRTDGL